MQNVVSVPVIERPVVAIRLETVAYLAVLLLALVLRVAALGAAPLGESETRAALAAYRAVTPGASGETLSASSPILFAAQGLAFGLFGGNEFAARLFTAVGGALLVLSPLLFRREFGGTRTFVLAVLLLFSPVELVASRFSAPALWSLIFAVLLLWALWRLRDHSASLPLRALAASSAAGLIFLSEAGGIVLAVILAGAGVLAYLWERQTRPFDFEDADEQPPKTAAASSTFNAWSVPLLVASAFVILIATGVLLYPAGLSHVGEVFAAFLRGFNEAPPESIPPFALYVSVFYEPFWWGLGIAGVVTLLYRQSFTVFERFFVAWVVLGILASLVWRGAAPYHALWFTLPLIGLTSSAVMAMLTPIRPTDIFAPPAWARWIVAAAFLAVLAVFTVSAQSLARSMLSSSSELLSSVTPSANSVILVIVSIMFMVIGFFLVASVWGNRTAVQGIGLGVLIFGAITSFGSGWGAALSESENPREPFHFYATSLDATLLRETLRELADRHSGGFTAMPLTIMAPQDGIVAWEARDFTQAEYIFDLREAFADPIVLLPQFEDVPDLGTSYVGQDFIIRRVWSPTGIYLIDYPTWWMQRHARFGWLSLETIVLWLRQDVYEGQMQEAVAG